MPRNTLFTTIVLLFVAGTDFVQAHVDFDHVYAPSEPWIKAPEKTFRDDICLNGSWQFQPVAVPASFKDGVGPAPELTPPTANGWEKTPLKVPSPWNVNGFTETKGVVQGGDFRCYPSYPEAWNDVKMGWLRRSFTVPAAWKGRRVLIHFAAAAGDMRFQINGKDAGKRFDIFLPFDLDVTDLVQFGASNEILVGIRKPSLFDVRGKYGSRTYQSGSFWGQHIVGLWQDVDLVAVPAVRISDVFVQPFVDQDTLKADVTLHNDSSTEEKVDVSGSAYPWISLADKEGPGAPEPKWKLGDAAALSLPSATVTVPTHGDRTVTLRQKVGNSLKFWTPDDPELYGLLLDVKSGGQGVDLKYTRFGWRQITLKGTDLLLNGKPLVLKGDAWHFMGIPQMTRRYPWAWFTALHDAHLNAVRLHAQPYPEFYLDVADERGVLLLDETAIWASDGGPKLDDDAFWKDTKGHIEQFVLRDRNHPSVFGWSVCNEVWPIVKFVFHNPPGMLDKLVSHYSIWLDICHRLDPTRAWVSADGDEDGGGKLPTYIIHYGDVGTMKSAARSGKPWGAGEGGNAWFASPELVAKTYGEKAYESYASRSEGLAIEAYDYLINERKLNAKYRSLFNMAWYSLEPLPLGLPDTTKPPTLDDGVFFPAFVEGVPGVQPERLGPCCTTFNPGYDPSLPLYKSLALFEAIKDAQAEPPVDLPWKRPAPAPAPPVEPSKPAPVKSIGFLSDANGKLRNQLAFLGVPFDDLKSATTPELLFIDGCNPPGADARPAMDAVLAAGGSVVVWGVSKDSLPKLNALLPAPLELTDRKSSSLVCDVPDPVTAGIKLSDMYFSQLIPPIILDGGLGGPLVDQSSVLLKASNTEWLQFLNQPEQVKTVMVFRSEREAKPSGAALIESKQGKGLLFVCNLPPEPAPVKAQTLNRHILENLGVPLKPIVDDGSAFLKTGQLIRVLACGHFSAPSDNPDKAFVDPVMGSSMKEKNEIGLKRWGVLSAEKGAFDLRKAPLTGPEDYAVSYASFWVFSPRPLDDLHPKANVPKLDLELQTADNIEIWLNGKSVFKSEAGWTGDTLQAEGLPLKRGWNHLLIRTLNTQDDDEFQAQLVSSQPDFLNDLKSATERP